MKPILRAPPFLSTTHLFVNLQHNGISHSALALLTHSTEQSPSWEANRFVASQEIPQVLLNPKVHYGIQNCSPPVSILSQPNPVHTPHPTSWRSILILSSHLSLDLSSGLFPHVFPPKPHTHLSPPHTGYMHAHLILPDFITRTVLGKEYRSWSFSFWGFLHCPVTSSLFGPNIFLSWHLMVDGRLGSR
jgi:hypothetical protein